MNIKLILKKVLQIDDLVAQKHNHTNKSTLDTISQTNISNWNDKYTKAETDNKIGAVVTGLDYKEHVSTFTDLSTTYQNPQEGWTVSVDSDDITYKYNGSEWIPISANSIPLATSSIDGKMSKQDKIDHDDMNNKKHTHSNKSIIDTITQAFIDSWNSAYTHIADTVKHITSSERNSWNNKLDSTANAVSSTKLVTARKINGIPFNGTEDITVTANPNPHTHDDRYYTESESDAKFATKDEISTAGYGDMLKSVYDIDEDGIVDRAKAIQYFSTTNSSNLYTGYYTKIASVSISTQYTDANTILFLTSTGSGSAQQVKGTLYFRVKQQNALGSVPYYDLKIANSEYINENNLVAVITTNTTSSTTVELYYKAVQSYDNLIITPLYNNGFIFYNNQPYLNSLPSGTQIICSQLNTGIASKLANARTIAFTGDVTGSGDFDGNSNISINATVTNDSHNHTMSTITNFASSVMNTILNGLSTATDTVISTTDSVLSALGKLQAQITANLISLNSHTSNTNNPHSTTASQIGLGNVTNESKTTMFTNPTFTGTATATTFNGTLNGNSSTSSKWLNTRTLTMSGDLSGSVIIDGSTNMTLTANVADDSHNHIISNVDGLQSALDNKSNISHNHDDIYVKLGALTWNQLKGV